MELKTILKRYPVFILGLYFLSLGIVLIVRSALGTTPISSINYVLSINSALSLGFPVNTDILQNENFIFLMFPGDDTEWGILLLLLWVLNSKFTDGNFYFL